MEPLLGQIVLFSGNFAPRGWAFCNGQLLDIASNEALFAILGTTYGGDGHTSFRLPDLRGRVPMHAGDGPGLTPRRLGEQTGSERRNGSTVEQLELQGSVAGQNMAPQPNRFGTSDDNMQPTLCMNYVIALKGTFPSRN
ncbi:phage tail protein [Loktanella sp. S4079]|uniref:phage tail protein n=1 Tax=Loktanella sp. S4079 TaxID=579483 RepID=UPI0005F9E30B|nr:tail fiber protein [Loktanella sp. S4079]KJZ19234.1 hypothetical protein TW80_10585 [Loktanella sp. S4079]